MYKRLTTLIAEALQMKIDSVKDRMSCCSNDKALYQELEYQVEDLESLCFRLKSGVVEIKDNVAKDWQQAYNDYVVYAAQEREVLTKKLEQTETALNKAEADLAEYRKIVANQSAELTKATEQFAQLIK